MMTTTPSSSPSIVLLVPYRDTPSQNRAAHLYEFTRYMPSVLDEAVGVGRWAILIGDHVLDGRRFSRGRALNALARIALARFGRDVTLLLHDVDLLPDAARAACYAAPFPSGCVLRALNSGGEYGTLATSRYIGGVAAMPAVAFETVNGFHNGFEGWGGEDDGLRDAIDAFYRTVPTSVRYAEDTTGTMRNLELEPAFAGSLRAHADPAAKSDKQTRRGVRAAAAAAGFTNGLHELTFTAAVRALLDCHDGITMYRLGLYPSLPDGWVLRMSRSTGLPYYVHPSTGASQYRFPSAAASATK